MASRGTTTNWYRFTDGEGNGSRVGRTITAPLPNDPRPVSFAFVSCQSLNEGRLNGYRRMLFEDERAARADQLGFVRADPQNLPDGMTRRKWPADTLAQIGSGDYGSAYHERGEIYDVVRHAKITGFAIVSGDRHSFWPGSPAMRCGPSSSASHVPSRTAFVPMAVLFATGSSTRRRSGKRASGLCCASRSSRRSRPIDLKLLEGGSHIHAARDVVS